MKIDVDSFIADGFVRVPGAVPRRVADKIRERAALLVADGPDVSWRLGMTSVYDLPILIDAVTPKVRAAFDALLGFGRWHVDGTWGFPTRFPGPCESLWHIDGDWFTHHVTSGEQALTVIFLWSDVGLDDSPTLLGVGSHHAVARLLAEHEPEGISGADIGRTVHANVHPETIVTATGDAGDVIVCHPFLAHAINPSGPTSARFISNALVHAYQPLDIEGTATKSPVEAAIQLALGG
jgi:hypothetical protein